MSAALHAARLKMKNSFWSDNMQKAFDHLKIKLTSNSLLVIQVFKEFFVIKSNASLVAVGAVLLRKKEDGRLHPILVASCTIKGLKSTTQRGRNRQSW